MKKFFHILRLVTLLGFFSLPYAAHADEFDDAYDMDYGQTHSDPIEGLNRAVFTFNEGLDIALINPAAQTYDFLLPEYAQNRVYYFLENIEAPVVFANALLQGDAENTFVTFWRFVFNSTLGVLGLFDIATELGMPPRRHEDFGQTLGAWGMGPGPYLVLPLIGSSSLRDAPGRVIDILINPFTYGLKPFESAAIGISRAIDSRARYDRFINQVYDSSLDPYATFRSLYFQRRQALVNNFDAAPVVK